MIKIQFDPYVLEPFNDFYRFPTGGGPATAGEEILNWASEEMRVYHEQAAHLTRTYNLSLADLHYNYQVELANLHRSLLSG